MDSPLSLKRLNCLKPLWSLDTERPHFRGKRVQTLDFNDGDYDDADEDDSDSPCDRSVVVFLSSSPMLKICRSC